MRILHTEASKGWGGQEIRILRESIGMRARGHEVLFAVNIGANLGIKAREAGFKVYEIDISRKKIFKAISQLKKIIKEEKCGLVNTHSSLDSWMGGIAARLSRTPVLRTRHLSAHIKAGLNSIALYRWFADAVVTTCESVADIIRRQARLKEGFCLSIPTGVDPTPLTVSLEEVQEFREKHGLKPTDIVAGTACILRSWKGISHFLQAAAQLRDNACLKWVIVGDGPCEALLKEECKKLGIGHCVIFTGFLQQPATAIAAMDIFLLLSTANEGVSQASLQAAYLEKPLVTTRTGGLTEVCIGGETGFLVDSASPDQVAESVKKLSRNPLLRTRMGQKAKALVEAKFTWESTLDQMEEMYGKICN